MPIVCILDCFAQEIARLPFEITQDDFSGPSCEV